MVTAVRNSAKAVVVKDGFLLAIKHRDSAGEWFSLPGGGQDPGETLENALRRECLEEIGVEVAVGPLCFIREYIGAHHEFSEEDSAIHQVEFIFECHLLAAPEAANPSKPDPHQIAWVWLPVASLPSLRLYPSVLRTILSRPQSASDPVYLGDVN